MRIGVTGAIRRVCRASGASSLPYGGHYGIGTGLGGGPATGAGREVTPAYYG
jgi:hypothetical protein